MIQLTTYSEAREAFRSRELRQALYDEGQRLMTGVIVNLHGEEHVARRRLENRLFRRDTFAWYERDRIPAIIDDVLHEARARGGGDLLSLAKCTMMTLSVEVAGVDRPTDPARFYELMESLARASTVTHATGDTEAVIERGDQALAEFDRDYFQPALAKRRELVAQVDQGSLAESSLPRDVLTTLVRNQDRLTLSPDTLLREIAYFPWVGSHSTSAQLVHALHHIFEWIARHPDDRAHITNDDLLRQRFVHESIRLHPASPVARRIAVTAVELRSGRRLPADATVDISVELANRDAGTFGSDAVEFNPHRKLPDGVPPWGLSFGHGTHACLGQELAGGLEQPTNDSGEKHLFGAVTLMAGAILRAGAIPDPARPPTPDASTTRTVWGSYPVLLYPLK